MQFAGAGEELAGAGDGDRAEAPRSLAPALLEEPGGG